jgi:hypothetical protein
MALQDVLSAAAGLLAVGLVGRAVVSLLRHPNRDHDELVPVRERRVTTAVGLPMLAVGLSTVAGGPFGVSGYGGTLLVLGGVMTVYPEFTPGSYG